MVARGEFREDLFYRLSVITCPVPALRERREDIPALAEHFLAKVRFQTGRRVAGFTPEALRAMMAHAWPGNVRELRNAVERAVVLGEGDLVRVEDLPPNVAAAAPGRWAPPTAVPQPRETSVGFPTPNVALTTPLAPASPAPEPAAAPGAAEPPPAARSLRELEKDGIVAALAATRGNKAQAAAILEIDRSTLYKKLKEYGLG